MIVVLVIIVLLLVAFFAFYMLKLQTIRNYQKYPPTTDCKAILDMFGHDLAKGGDFAKYAEIDGPLTDDRRGTGLYQCYC